MIHYLQIGTRNTVLSLLTCVGVGVQRGRLSMRDGGYTGKAGSGGIQGIRVAAKQDGRVSRRRQSLIGSRRIINNESLRRLF
jgi:hypothetical protein